MTRMPKIIEIARPLLQSDDLPVEVEYEDAVVSQYPLGSAEVTPSGILFSLGTKHTACLAPEKCGVGGEACCTPPAPLVSLSSHRSDDPSAPGTAS